KDVVNRVSEDVFALARWNDAVEMGLSEITKSISPSKFTDLSEKRIRIDGLKPQHKKQFIYPNTAYVGYVMAEAICDLCRQEKRQPNNVEMKFLELCRNKVADSLFMNIGATERLLQYSDKTNKQTYFHEEKLNILDY